MSDPDKVRDRIQQAIEDAAAAGELKGLPVSWSMWIDSLAPDDTWWWTLLTKDKQLPSTSVGHGVLLQRYSEEASEDDDEE